MTKKQNPAEKELERIEARFGMSYYNDSNLEAKKEGILLGMKEARASAIKKVMGIMDRLEDEEEQLHSLPNYRLLWNKLRTKITPEKVN